MLTVRTSWTALSFCVIASLAASIADAEDENPAPVLLDTDIGSYVDDAFALGLVLASPELELVGVTTVGERAEDRAWIAARFLSHSGHGSTSARVKSSSTPSTLPVSEKGIPVAHGRGEQPKSEIDWQIQYRRHPAAIYNRTDRPLKESAVELMYGQLKAAPGEVTIIALGPLTNVAALFEEHPDAVKLVKRLVILGGSIATGYDGKPPAAAEWNIKSDVAAARAVFSSGAPLVVVPLDATVGLTLTGDARQKIFGATTRLTLQMQALYQLHGEESPALFDVAAVAMAADQPFFKTRPIRFDISDDGITAFIRGKPNAQVALECNHEKLLAWASNRLAEYDKPSLPEPPKNPSKLIDRGPLPRRVHTFEDYETDIEKRWWMSGRLELKDVPSGKRACRSVLTQDFDGRMGDVGTSYAAVVFNPVPGPPMGPKTRLAFRYKLAGTDTLRIQLYSLSNGYHRYLSVSGLKQGEWQTAAVDMTKMRRPDGSGGPLAEDERIDDIQFYADPRAEIWTDDVVLYEAGGEDETRPFPRRIVYTGWFDTGKQGNEWPGDFEIVLHKKPRTWDAAKSVPDETTGLPWLRLHFRGRRPLGESTRLRFLYKLDKPGPLRLVLADTEAEQSVETTIEKPSVGEWAEAFVDFPPGSLKFADELRIYGSKGVEVLVDDVLVYEPGGAD